MPETASYIPITKELRDTIKGLKRELTYDQYFNYLLINSEGKNPQSKVPKKTNSKEANR